MLAFGMDWNTFEENLVIDAPSTTPEHFPAGYEELETFYRDHNLTKSQAAIFRGLVQQKQI